MPDKLTSVGWSDGDIQHLKAIIKDEIYDQCINYKNVRCKQSAKRTGMLDAKHKVWPDLDKIIST
eukprot:9334505-Ditylum_brightwellii.AAC.1